MGRHSETWAIDEIRKEAMENGFELHPDHHMGRLLDENPQVLVEFMNCGNDTVSRECLRDALARTFAGETEWPRVLEGGKDYARRWNAFRMAVVRAAMAGRCDIRTAKFRGP